MKIKFFLAGLLGISLLGISLAIAEDYEITTITNTATIRDEETGHSASASASVIHKQPNNTLVVQKWVDNPLPDLGEEITYTIRIKNDADTLVTNGVVLVDDFDETKVGIIGIISECTLDGLGNQVCTTGTPPLYPPETQCTVDASRLVCDFGALGAQSEKIIKYSVYTLATGTIINTATATSAYGESVGGCTVLVRDRETPWLLTKNPDKGTIERGETVSYTVSITNQAPDKTYYDLRLVDNYPENTIELESIITDSDVSCQDDGAEIRCQIPSFAPAETKSFTATFRAIMDGVAQNTVVINDQEGYIDGVSSTIVVTEPIATDIVLSSNCDGRTVLVGQKCQLRLLAHYNFLPPEDISNNDNVTYYGFEEIGTLEGNTLTITNADYAQIHARYFTGHQEIESNSITINVDNAIGVGTDLDGNHIAHIPLRLHQGASETAVFDQILRSTQVAADPRAGAKYDRLVINGYGGSGAYTWFLEDPSIAQIYDFSTGSLCPPINGGLGCVDSSNIILESLSSEETVTTLSIVDDAGNSEEIMVHLLPAVTKKIEIADTEGTLITETQYRSLGQTIAFSSQETLWGGLQNTESTGEHIIWEFLTTGGSSETTSSNATDTEAIDTELANPETGGFWVTGTETATLAGGVFQSSEPGIFRIRARKVQNVALPGSDHLTQEEETVISEPITIFLSPPVPKIESIRTAGNLGIAKGAREKLYIRMSHFGTFSEVHDIEINLVKGEYENLEDIPVDVQYFSIEVLEDEVLQSVADDKTTLLEVPFFVPLLQDLRDGKHTLLFNVRNANGEAGDDAPTALLSLYIGTPMKGDGNLDGNLDLRDAVIMKRVLKKTVVADSLVFFALDIDENGKIESYDFLNAFLEFLKRFLNS